MRLRAATAAGVAAALVSMPVAVSSIAPCPAPPNAGDPVLVQVTVTFPGAALSQL